MLKKFVAANPSVVKLSAGHALGVTEWALPSGDSVDVVFQSPGRVTAVEVKAALSGQGDIARGVYQCVKYQAVLKAQSLVSKNAFDVSVILVLGGKLAFETKQLANALGVTVLDKISPD